MLAFDVGEGRQELRTAASRGALRTGVAMLGALAVALALAVPTTRSGRRRATRVAGLFAVSMLLGDLLAGLGLPLGEVVAATVVAAGAALALGSLLPVSPDES